MLPKETGKVYVHFRNVDRYDFIFCCCLFNAEPSAKVVATAFWRGEVENELQRVGMCDFKFKADTDYDRCMQ